MDQENRIRILVIDDDKGFSRLMDRMLTNEGFDPSVAHTGEEGLNMLRVVKPQMLLVDLMLPGMDGFEVVRRVRQMAELKGIPILMLTALTDRESRVAGYAAGVDDYLTKPFEPKDLIYRVRSLLANAEARHKPHLALGQSSRVIVFFSGKGGVGKTTISTNLAIAIQKVTQSRVLLFDADFSFGDVGVHLNVSGDPTVLDLVAQGMDMDVEAVREAVISHSSGISVLLSPPRPQQGELVTTEALGRVFPLLRQLFEYIIIDGQPAYDDRMLYILEQADDIMLVVTPEVGPIRNTSLFLDLAEMLELDKPSIHLILNRSNSRVGIEMGDIQRILKHPISYRIISGGRAVVVSVNQGIPLLTSQPDHPLAQQITEMAKHLTGSTKT